MTCYMITQHGEPVALVSELTMARAIAECQPWGDYLVEALEMGEPIVAGSPRSRVPSGDPPSVPGRRAPAGSSPRWTHGIPPSAIVRARREAH